MLPPSALDVSTPEPLLSFDRGLIFGSGVSFYFLVVAPSSLLTLICLIELTRH
jgi:hypothetical protein